MKYLELDYIKEWEFLKKRKTCREGKGVLIFGMRDYQLSEILGWEN